MSSIKIITKLGFVVADVAAECAIARLPIGAKEYPNAPRLIFLKKVLLSIV